MQSPLPYQDAIHRAASVEEVGDVVKQFFANMGDDFEQLHPQLQTISTFSERGLCKKAKLARFGPETASSMAVEKVLATAALRVGVLCMDAANTSSVFSKLRRG